MIALLIRLYRLIPFRPKCRCNHPDGLSCSQRGLILARRGALTLAGLALAAQSCGSPNPGPTCMPYDPSNPNDPNQCPPSDTPFGGPSTQAPGNGGAQATARLVHSSNGGWRVL